MAAFNILCAALGGAAFLLMGWGVRGLLYASIGSAVLTLLIYTALVRKLLPAVTMNPLLADIDQAKKVLRFSLQIYLTQASVAIHNQIEKLFLALFVGVVPVGWYDIASDVALKVRGAPGLLLSPVLPAASELDARGEQDKLVELYYRVHKYLAFAGVPLIAFLIAVSKRFVELWIGPDYKIVALPLSILLLVNFFNLTTGPGYMIFAGQGFLQPGVYSALVGVGLNVPLSLLLIYFYGFGGAVVGTSISIVVASSFFLVLFHRHTRNSVARLLREAYFKPVLCTVVLLTSEFLISPARNLSWLGLFLHGSVFALAYAAVLLSTRFFDQYDWAKIESVVPVARIAKRIVPVG
jgi:O-antigen/teichoic acid export membrane protein